MTVEENNAVSRKELDRLRAQAEKLPEMEARLKQLRASVPEGTDVPGFIDEIDRVASEAGVVVASYTTSDAVPYAPPAAVEPTQSTEDTTPPSTPSATAPATAPAAPSVTTDPTITSGNFSVVPVTVAVDGSFDEALRFVSGLQSGERLFLITAVSSTQQSGDDGTASGTSTWTFGGSVYVLDPSAVGAGNTPSDTSDDS
ncbi:hypothetical protein DEJ34_14535 [Curtobacterium sp. MCPF17_050]|uniref:hypothetical protein n=1 Tax=Curtobacterium sp. MCPF17_050 TaxID=2175664 RepID=UPI0015E8D3A6|nr:hypothetical protein [Curtobacterium sp. MCPF17_050]WIB15332.1 hypothetical protein DEJ34_14535 [Curtobacterium sp. MCPF17_050]